MEIPPPHDHERVYVGSQHVRREATRRLLFGGVVRREVRAHDLPALAAVRRHVDVLAPHVDTFVIGRNLEAAWAPERQKLLGEMILYVVDIDRTRPGVQDIEGEIRRCQRWRGRGSKRIRKN